MLYFYEANCGDIKLQGFIITLDVVIRKDLSQELFDQKPKRPE